MKPEWQLHESEQYATFGPYRVSWMTVLGVNGKPKRRFYNAWLNHGKPNCKHLDGSVNGVRMKQVCEEHFAKHQQQQQPKVQR